MHLNVLNLRLQRRDQNISHLVGHVEIFKMKLRLLLRIHHSKGMNLLL